jgi:hypothetical protein
VLSACPALGPKLASWTDGTIPSFEALRSRLREPQPVLATRCPIEECHDQDLVADDSVILLPIVPETTEFVLRRASSWLEASSLCLELKRRGMNFERLRRARVSAAQHEIHRLAQLDAHLSCDLAGLKAAFELRRQAEALLAWSSEIPQGASAVEIPDPRAEDRSIHVAIDPSKTRPQNANVLFDKARRSERAREMIEKRLAQTRDVLVRVRAEESRAYGARDMSDLPPVASATIVRSAAPVARPMNRRFLTSRGLMLLVGRSARDNHRLTFELARPDDYWLHVRDSTGAHVILRDPDGRANKEDLQEAAAVAAFYSDLGQAKRADVHVTRRKFLRPAGGPGRVRIAHSETLRVSPFDPEGRLRRA